MASGTSRSLWTPPASSAPSSGPSSVTSRSRTARAPRRVSPSTACRASTPRRSTRPSSSRTTSPSSPTGRPRRVLGSAGRGLRPLRQPGLPPRSARRSALQRHRPARQPEQHRDRDAGRCAVCHQPAAHAPRGHALLRRADQRSVDIRGAARRRRRPDIRPAHPDLQQHGPDRLHGRRLSPGRVAGRPHPHPQRAASGSTPTARFGASGS